MGNLVTVLSITDLKKILDNDSDSFKDFAIILNPGVLSRKEIRLLKDYPDKRFKSGKADKYQVHHCISGTMEMMTEKQLQKSLIGEAMAKGQFYRETWEPAQ